MFYKEIKIFYCFLYFNLFFCVFKFFYVLILKIIFKKYVILIYFLKKIKKRKHKVSVKDFKVENKSSGMV
jgi:hypothetical protein